MERKAVWGNGMPKGEISLGSPRCAVCKRKNVDEINKELAQGLPVPLVGIRHKIATRSLYKHKENHVLTDNYRQGLLVVGVRDIMNIPLDMRQRRELQNELVEQILAPMTREGPGSGVNAIQWQMLINVWKLQMQDEQTIMRVTGILKDNPNANEMGLHEQLGVVRERIESMLKVMVEEGGIPAEKARAAMSQFLSPNPQLPMGRDTVDVSVDGEWAEYVEGV